MLYYSRPYAIIVILGTVTHLYYILEEFLSLQPMFPPKRFDSFPLCSDWVDAEKDEMLSHFSLNIGTIPQNINVFVKAKERR